MAGRWSRLKSINSSLFPQLINVKQGRLGRLYNIILDYRDVFKQILLNWKEKPVRTTSYLTLIGSLYFCSASNPGEDSYNERLMASSNELLLIDDSIRSRRSNSYVRNVMDLNTKGCLVHVSCGFFSIILQTPFARDLDLYEKHCYYVQPRWLTVNKRIIDFGFCGYWFNLEKAMINFDINEEEFPDELESSTSVDLTLLCVNFLKSFIPS